MSRRAVGTTQRAIISYLKRLQRERKADGRDDIGGYIGSTCQAPEFRGMELKPVNLAIARLMFRGIIRAEGPLPRYILVEP